MHTEFQSISGSHWNEEAGHADDRIELEQRKSDGRVIKVYFSLLELFDKRGGKRVHINFQAERQHGFRTQARTDTSKFCSCDRLMEPERITPKSLIAGWWMSIPARSESSRQVRGEFCHSQGGWRIRFGNSRD